MRVGALIQAFYTCTDEKTPWLTGWHNAQVLCVNDKNMITITFDDHPEWGKCIVAPKQTRARDKAPVSAVRVVTPPPPAVEEIPSAPETTDEISSEADKEPKSNKCSYFCSLFKRNPKTVEEEETSEKTVQPVKNVTPEARTATCFECLGMRCMVKRVPIFANENTVPIVLSMPVEGVKNRNWPRFMAEGTLSTLVESAFKEMKGTAYRITYKQQKDNEPLHDVTHWLEDEEDWHMAVEYFDEIQKEEWKPKRLEFKIVKIKQNKN
jgi:hypothetical protein